MSTKPRLWAAIPAAGAGKRMASPIPKQYLELLGHKVIDHTIHALLDHPDICGVTIATSADDEWWPHTRYANHAQVRRVNGGKERIWSVLNILADLAVTARPDDWVLVHDAARPCLHRTDLDALISACKKHPVGGLLGMPVRDTMKRTSHQQVIENTVPRENLWHAFTPQMFRLEPLLQAIKSAVTADALITDEAGAMEQAGKHPLMIEGHPGNIKITRPGDLALAEFFLQQNIAKQET